MKMLAVLSRIAWIVMLSLSGAKGVQTRDSDHSGHQAIADFRSSPALKQAVDSVCSKKIVFLGEEAHHVLGGTLQLKTALVERLVDRCGFTDIIFEGQVYDFIDFNRSVREGKETKDQMADAIGGLWSLSAESDVLIDFLYAGVKAKRISVAGFDSNTQGATARYSRDTLPSALASRLPVGEKDRCGHEFRRYARWEYDDRDPFDKSAQGSLLQCAAAAKESFGTARSIDARNDDQVMVASFYADVSDAIDPVPNARESMMYENLVRMLDRLPQGHKAIVWTATVHAIANPEARAGFMSVGQRLRGERSSQMAVIAVSAYSGRYEYNRETMPLAEARMDSLEALAFRQRAGVLAWLDKRALSQARVAPSRALNYQRWTMAAWGALLDGMLVLREESPAPEIRPRQPRQRSPSH